MALYKVDLIPTLTIGREISKNCSNDKNDEDRNVGNRNGKIRQS